LDPVIYKLTNKVNGHAYVGKAKNSYKRMWQHRHGKSMRGAKTGKMQLVDKKIQQYGWDNFDVEYLETNVDPALLLEREAHWMKHHNTLVPHGYNIMKPGVEVISMSDPDIRARWEAANPAGTVKSVATKRKKREEVLAGMDVQQAAELRYRLDKEAARNGKRYRGEEMEPDGRFQPSAKRQATWDAKRAAKMAAMTPEQAAKYWAKSESQRKYANKNKSKIAAKQSQPSYREWQKEYRKDHKSVRLHGVPPTQGDDQPPQGRSAVPEPRGSPFRSDSQRCT
jgi:group I intron endonuclease